MSEIFAPGSIAGPPTTFLGAYNGSTTYSIGQAVSSSGSSYVSLVNSNVGNAPASSPTQWGLLAAAGAAGAAGSTSCVTALSGATLPSFVGVNLFDYSKLTGATQVNSDGSLTVGGQPSNATALIYCPGATSMISNLSINAGNWGAAVCLYDANGTFISALPTSEFTMIGGQEVVTGAAAFALPGTQVYVRFGYVVPWLSGNSNNWCQTDTLGMVYATISGTATLPGSFSPAGLATAASVTTAVAAATSNLSNMLSVFEQAALAGPFGSNRNAFDYTKALANTFCNSDGSLTVGGSATGWDTATVFAPQSTSFITNIPIYINHYSGNPKVCTYDENGTFLQDITSSLITVAGGDGNRIPVNTSCPLPGNQTYVKFSWSPGGGGFGSGSYPNTIESCVFYSGTTAAPPPALTALNFSTPFGGNAPINVKTATQLGCSIDGSFDATALLNAFLATASSSNPIKLVLDAMFNTSGLVIASAGHTMIEGLGAGTGINVSGPNDGIRIGGYTSGTGNSEGAYNITPPSRTAVNIVLRDFTINPAGQTNASANQPVSGDPAHGTYPLILANCSNVLCDNLNFLTGGTNYCITASNADHVRITNCVFTTTGYTRDAIHIDGPSNDIGIDNCDISTGDDGIALNAPEGYGGDISRVTVTNCRFYNALTVMRIYTSLDPAAMASNNVHKVRNVVVSNCTGSVTSMCFNLGITGGGLSSTSDVDQIQDLRVSNCSFIAPQGLAVLLVPAGSLVFEGIHFTPTGTSQVVQSFYGIGNLVLRDVTVLRNGNGSSTPASFFQVATGVVDRLTLNACRVVDEHGSSYTAVPCLFDTASGSIGTLYLEAIDMTQITALASGAGYGSITALRGSGVLGTGASIPDATMDNGWLYLSSNDSGAVSLKVGGTAKRVNLT